MSLPDFFFERVTSEIHQQMEGVLALAERLARQPLSADAQTCVAGVAEAAACVRQILASSADLKDAATSGMAFEPAPKRLRDLADEIEARWGQKAAKSGVTLLVSYDGAPEMTALIDSTRVMQAFDGFIAQALAGVRHGAVEATLRAHAAGDMLRLEGRVRGGGERSMGDKPLDIQEIEALFGLETALSVELGRQIVKAVGGEIRTEANAGAGETLVFEFTAPHAVEASDEPLADESGGHRAAHILVVDDNATNRMVAETLCEMFDCTSESAVDGVEALEAARTGRFDLILMDIKMPRMDGVTATHAIRALKGAAGKVPIIALTANADPEDAAGYLAAGMNGVVEKPMKPENLLRALQENLGGGSDEESVAA
ncbi:response regulator [Phenylobacterium sp.]|uniref:response regulator n=1 Tax=Phenylobacterium sp. TaxID=1871053 RepID=UPI002727F846|nr:response regulator [Phenylobacterium sp.]MDO8378613.1 response regulator [Phenylobacterium sp.]